MITIPRSELQQALDALEDYEPNEAHKTIEALRARLAQPEPEPVAYGVLDDDGQIDWTVEYPFSNEPGWPDSVPLYTAPPQREWQGLTNEEVHDIKGYREDRALYKFARAIEAKLKEKNK